MAIGKARIAEVIFKYRSQGSLVTCPLPSWLFHVSWPVDKDVLIADGIAPRGSSRAALPPGPSHVNAVAGPSHSKKRKASAPSGCAKVEDRKRLKVTEEVRALKVRRPMRSVSRDSTCANITGSLGRSRSRNQGRLTRTRGQARTQVGSQTVFHSAGGH